MVRTTEEKIRSIKKAAYIRVACAFLVTGIALISMIGYILTPNVEMFTVWLIAGLWSTMQGFEVLKNARLEQELLEKNELITKVADTFGGDTAL